MRFATKLDCMAQAVLIVNPYSTRVTGDRIAQVEATLRRRVELRTEFTRGPGHATDLAAEAAGNADAIVIFSGDGTYNEALNGADGALPVGFLPGGGTSVFARSLGLSRDPIAAAQTVAEAIAAGRSRRISVGRVNGRRFCFSAGVGFDAEAVRRLDALGRDPAGARPGDAAFMKMVVRMVREHRGRWEPALEIVGAGRAAFILVANSDPYTYAGSRPVRVVPGARLELGLDYVAPTRVTPWSVPRFLTYVVRGRGQLGARDVLSGHDLDRIEIRCDRPLPLQADGEDLGDVEHVVFEAERNALSVLV
jgi:diacylglycerol kinase family enzyme